MQGNNSLSSPEQPKVLVVISWEIHAPSRAELCEKHLREEKVAEERGAPRTEKLQGRGAPRKEELRRAVF
jgi:hypothetical protein